jgi:hypothetical protein
MFASHTTPFAGTFLATEGVPTEAREYHSTFFSLLPTQPREEVRRESSSMLVMNQRQLVFASSHYQAAVHRALSRGECTIGCLGKNRRRGQVVRNP